MSPPGDDPSAGYSDHGPAGSDGPTRDTPLVGRELLKRYRERLPGRISDLEDALSRFPDDRGAEDELREMAHVLRGSGTSYGYPEITELASRVEGAEPGALAEAAENLLEALRRAAASGEDERSTVLVVEDDPEIRYLLETLLDGEGRQVVSVAGAADARAVLEVRFVDLVVLDLVLPDSDGRTLLRHIRERASSAAVPVVVVSAHDEPTVRAECFRQGADAYFRKPFDPDTLAAAVETHLDRATREGDRARRDRLTGLVGPVGLREAWESRRGGGDDGRRAVALVALDGFDGVALRHGWSVAERALKRLGAAIAEAVGDAGRVGRWEGDTFVALFHGQGDGVRARVEAALEGVRTTDLTGPDGETFRMTASAGLASGSPSLDALDDVMDRALGKLHRARRAGGNRLGVQGTEEGSRRIIVAEDDDITASLVQHRLERDGFEVEWHANGTDAFEAAVRSTPDLILLDVRMPGMDGFELLERLRKVVALRDVPIMLLTSMGSEADLVRGFRLGADDYVLKPFSPPELLARVHRLMSRRP